MHFHRVKRREFITLLGGTAAWPLAARAQQPDRVRRLGVLMGWGESDPEAKLGLATFVQELRRLGWADGRNLRTDTRWATPADPESMHRFAKELAALQPDLILSHNTNTTVALLQQTRTIPVVFVTVADPVGSGFVASLARPGGNATGFVVMESSLGGKWVELLKEIAPRVTRVAALFNPEVAPYADYWLKPFKAAAPSFGVEVIDAPVHNTSELESSIAAQAREPNSGGLFVLPDGFMNSHRVEIISLVARYRLPAVYAFRYFTELGGLLSYGDSWIDNFLRSAAYADRILKGEKPSELPIQAPVKFELVINLKTAKSLGLDVPWQLQQLADEVIE
jgi:putative tryptophan/tyrosine transport system substrate-binding protein